ncbi:MAG: DUF937 domain-containing protein [Hyphomicrobiales bacterium]|nr:DUF937 domain-containing protein [Hyphomicrobiales bacterium]
MKLYRIIAEAQSGRVFETMGQTFGLSDEMAAQVVRYFLPPIRKVLERRCETLDGMISVLEFLGSRRCDRVMEDARMFGHARVSDEGERIVNYLFGDTGYARKLIEKRAKVLGVDAAALEKMLPFIAVLAIGAVEKRTRRPLGAVLQRIAKGETDPKDLLNPYSALAAHLRLRRDGERAGARRPTLFGSLFTRAEPRAA